MLVVQNEGLSQLKAPPHHRQQPVGLIRKETSTLSCSKVALLLLWTYTPLCGYLSMSRPHLREDADHTSSSTPVAVLHRSFPAELTFEGQVPDLQVLSMVAAQANTTRRRGPSDIIKSTAENRNRGRRAGRGGKEWRGRIKVKEQGHGVVAISAATAREEARPPCLWCLHLCELYKPCMWPTGMPVVKLASTKSRAAVIRHLVDTFYMKVIFSTIFKF